MIVLELVVFLAVCINTFFSWQLQQEFHDFETDMAMVLFDKEENE